MTTLLSGVEKSRTIYDRYGRVAQQTYMPGLSGMTTLVYAPDPLGRTIEQVYPDGASVTMRYLTGSGAYQGYPKVETTDEIGNASSSVMDILGRVVLQTDALGGETEYTYTSFDAINAISPPLGQDYGYGYDGRRRLRSKTVPGQGTTNYDYSDDNLLKFTQLSNSAYVYVAYDEYNRETATALGNAPGSSGGARYDLSTLPGDKLTQNNYGTIGIEKGKIKSQEVAFILPDGSVGDMIMTSFTIDPLYGRTTGQEDNYSLGGTSFRDQYSSTLNMRDLPEATSASHLDYGTQSLATYGHSQGFDVFARPENSNSTLSWLKGNVNPSPGIMNSTMSYNNADQLTSRSLLNAGAGGVYGEDIGYNIRGWLTSINNTQGRSFDAGFCGDPRGDVYAPLTSDEELTLEEIFSILQEGGQLTIGDLNCEPDGDYETCVDEIADSSIGTNLGINNQGLTFPFAAAGDRFARLQALEGLCPRNDFSAAYDFISASGDTSIFATSPLGLSSLDVVHFGYWRRFFQINTLLVTDVLTGVKSEVTLTGAPYVFPTDPFGFTDDETDLLGYVSPTDVQLEIQDERDRFSNDFATWLSNNEVRYDSLYWGDGITDIQKQGFAIYLTASSVSLTEVDIDYSYELYLQCNPDEKVTGPVLFTTADEYFHTGEEGNHQTVPCLNLHGNTEAPEISVELPNLGGFNNGLIKHPNQLSYPTKIYQLKRSPDADDQIAMSNVFFAQELDKVSAELTIGKIFKIDSPQKSFEIEMVNGNVYQVSASQLINLRESTQVADIRTPTPVSAPGGTVVLPPGEPGCDDTVPSCSASEMQAQQDQVAVFYSQMTSSYINSLSYPLTLYSVLLCDGTYAYLTGDQVAGLPGSYTIVTDIEIPGANGTLGVSVGGGVNQLFGLKLDYRENGNIRLGEWKTTYHAPKKYRYQYDALNRIKSAKYSQGTVTTVVDIQMARNVFTVKDISYDAIGNIKTLTREGAAVINGELEKGDIDVLSYAYYDEGATSFVSYLKTVSDGAEEVELKKLGFDDNGATPNDTYGYDASGRMISDPYRGITSITYNHLDLPSSIVTTTSIINIVYDATGRKWTQTGEEGTRLYAAGMEFLLPDGQNETYDLAAASTAAGRLIFDPTGGKGGKGEIYAEYHHRDHLGNTRVAFTDRDKDGRVELLGPNSEVVQHLDYYPFGMTHDVTCLYPEQQSDNRYRYNGKEFSEELGLYDYGARWYDPATARWGQVDPLAERRSWINPYNYVQNNPILRIDPDGLTDYTFNKGTGEVQAVEGTENNKRDRLLTVKTDDDGNVLRKENGKAKTSSKFAVAKGILSDGMNLKDDDQIIDVGGQGEPSETDIQEFMFNLGTVLNKEIGGLFYAEGGTDVTSYSTIGGYANNTDTKTVKFGKALGDKREGRVTTHMHTHPADIRQSGNDQEPSGGDIRTKNRWIRQGATSVNFIILTKRAKDNRRLRDHPY